MAQWVEMFATKPDDLNWVFKTNTVEKSGLPQVFI